MRKSHILDYVQMSTKELSGTAYHNFWHAMGKSINKQQNDKLGPCFLFPRDVAEKILASKREDATYILALAEMLKQIRELHRFSFQIL